MMLRWLLSIIVVIIFAITWQKIPERVRVWLTPIIVVVMVSGCYYLITVLYKGEWW